MRSELEAVIFAIVVLRRKMRQLGNIPELAILVENKSDYSENTWRERRSSGEMGEDISLSVDW